MILHLGNDCFVASSSILMILDYDEAMKNPDTAKFLQAGEQVTISEGDQPKSVIVTEEYGEQKLYISPISPQTLHKRSVTEDWKTMV